MGHGVSYVRQHHWVGLVEFLKDEPSWLNRLVLTVVSIEAETAAMMWISKLSFVWWSKLTRGSPRKTGCVSTEGLKGAGLRGALSSEIPKPFHMIKRQHYRTSILCRRANLETAWLTSHKKSPWFTHINPQSVKPYTFMRYLYLWEQKKWNL